MNEKIKNSWIGPIPYELQDAQNYYGREREKEQFFELFGNTKLLLITGSSGVGKSSFLYGGIVDEIKIKLKDKPILIAKNWGVNYGVKSIDLENNILEDMHKNYAYSLYEDEKKNYPKNQVLTHYSINDDINNNNDFLKMPEVKSHIIKEREEELGENFCDGNFFDSIKYVAEKHHGAILIFDQFEEILHSNSENAQVAMKILTDLVEYVSNIRIIVAFRKEYFADFNPLEKKLGGMYGRTIFLDHFNQEDCQSITNQILKEMDVLVCSENQDIVTINNEVIPIIKDKIAVSIEAINFLIEQCKILSTKKKLSPGDSESNISNRVDMLAYQSVMYHLFNWLNKIKDGNRLITTDYLKKFELFLNDEIGYKKIQDELYSISNKALYVWFNDAVDECVKQNISWKIKGKVNGKNIDISLPIFMFIVDICPYLSSDTYKSSCDEVFLRNKIVSKNVKNVTDSEMAKKNLSGDLWKTITGNFENNEDKNDEELKLFLKDNGMGFLNETLDRALELMQRNKILKSFSFEENKRWEIRHDKLGEIANIWSGYNENTLKYVVSSYSVSKASLSFPKEMKKEYTWLRFRAPYFDLEDSKSALSVDFRNCDFTASVFDNIHFKKCIFTHCNMEGVVFFDCTFEDVKFNDCDFKGTLMKSKRTSDRKGNIILGKGLAFIACDIIISEFSDIIMNGQWNIYHKNPDKDKVNVDRDYVEFSLSSIWVKDDIKSKKNDSIIFHEDVKSNNLMVNVDALKVVEFISTNINGLSLLARESNF